MKTWLILLVLLAFPAAGMADEIGKGMLYTTLSNEKSNQSSVPYDSINRVRDEEVQYVVPESTLAFTSKQWATHMGYNFLVGDLDGDGSYYQTPIFGKIDALLHPRDANGDRVNTINMRQLFFSVPIELTSSVVAAAPFVNTLNPSSVGRIVPGGQFELFISHAQVGTAFGINPEEKHNLDAVMLHLTDQWDKKDQGIYLSFEETVTIDNFGISYTVHDGAVLRIPEGGITWGVSTYDGVSQLVAAVVPYCGEIIMTESEMDAYVSKATVNDNGGTKVCFIGDLDGLTLPTVSGSFSSQYATKIHHFWFCGEDSNGGGAILSTEAFGSIPSLNGVSMANNDPGTGATTGEQVGLVTPNGVGSLNGLALSADDLPHFVLATGTPGPSGPGVIDVQIGGAPVTPPGFVFFGWELGNSAIAGVDVGVAPPPAFAIRAGTFPEFFKPHKTVPPFLVRPKVDADNCASWSIDTTTFYPLVAGLNLCFQAAYVSSPDIWLSAPCKIQF